LKANTFVGVCNWIVSCVESDLATMYVPPSPLIHRSHSTKTDPGHLALRTELPEVSSYSSCIVNLVSIPLLRSAIASIVGALGPGGKISSR
jgi:hypothetical protein